MKLLLKQKTYDAFKKKFKDDLFLGHCCLIIEHIVTMVINNCCTDTFHIQGIIKVSHVIVLLHNLKLGAGTGQFIL